MKMWWLFMAGSLGFLLAAQPTEAAADAIYRETFGNTAGQVNLSSFGWSAYYGNAAVNATLAAPGAAPAANTATAMASGGPSAGSGPFPGDINAGLPGPHPSADHSQGFATTPIDLGTVDVLSFTNEYVADRAQYSIDSFSFYATSSVANDGTFTSAVQDSVYAVVQIAGNWYVSAASVSPTVQSSADSTTFQAEAGDLSVAFNPAAGNWRVLNFTPGAPLSIGANLAGVLPAGNVTGFGLYWDAGPTSDRNTPRWDTFEVNATAVPEPASLVLLASGAAPFVLARRARKRRPL